eukprot:417325_1
MSAEHYRKCFKDEPFTTSPIILTIVASTILIVTITIAISAVKQFQKLEQLNKTIKYLFYTSILATFTRCICSMVAHMACICDIIILFVYFLLLLSLLGTLLVRLKVTFDNSVYELSPQKMIMFLILYILTAICFSISVIYYVLAHIETYAKGYFSMHYVHTMILGAVALIFYVFTGAFAVAEFSKKLLTLTKLRANTSRNVNANNKLNEKQHQLINQIAKYNALFSVAACTSLTVSIVVFLFAVFITVNDRSLWVTAVVQSISNIDCAVNVICLWLQYQIAAKYYDKYCICVDKCWKEIFKSRALDKPGIQPKRLQTNSEDGYEMIASKTNNQSETDLDTDLDV